ncbi:MAG: peptidylglycine alpha-amidating monooxygenase [Myxococcaceae bacterium]|nr:peptidylglycine alpha-amidating monooxygenase [Myxococcaceae bacterium]
MAALDLREQARRLCFLLVGLTFISSCDGSDPAGGAGGQTGESVDAQVAKPTDAGGKKTESKGRDSGVAVVPDASAPSAAKLALPANVCKVLQDNGCLTCHRDPPQSGSPMALLLPSDFDGKAVDGTPIKDKVLARIRDPQNPMPPAFTGRAAPSDADLASLTAWFSAGAKGVSGPACDPDVTSEPVGPMPTPEWAKQPWPADECEQVITLGAHNGLAPLAQDPSGFPISTAHTDYHCFYEQVSYSKPMQAIGLRARLESDDDKELVHHLVVSAQEAGDNSLAGAKPNFSGDHKHCDNPTGSTLAVYAPGSQNPITTPRDVGILMPNSNSYFELQVHYNNPKAKPGKVSRIQYDICLTSKLRPQTAGTFWLGFENANVQTISGAEFIVPLDNKGNGKAVGQCAAKNKGRILSIMPHMHEQGKHATLAIKRAKGTTETLIDAPFRFQDQASFFWDDMWVDSGDTIISTCEWMKSPVNFGFASDLEMCFFYTLAYPLETFKANPLLGERGIVGGNLACAGAAGP